MTRFFLLTVTILCLTLSAVQILQAQDSQTQTQTQPSSGIVSHLTSKLGVTPEQAMGGAGAIFQLSKQKLSADDFSKLATAVPEVDSLIKAVPAAEGVTSMLGSAAGVAGLVGPFQKLGMQPEMVGKFVPEVLSYVQTKGGDALRNTLANVLK